jgi:hypothetical protein
MMSASGKLRLMLISFHSIPVAFEAPIKWNLVLRGWYPCLMGGMTWILVVHSIEGTGCLGYRIPSRRCRGNERNDNSNRKGLALLEIPALKSSYAVLFWVLPFQGRHHHRRMSRKIECMIPL